MAPNWSLPKGVRAIQTTRCGGVSRGAYQGLNLGLHVGDESGLVQQNRQQLLDSMLGCEQLHWLEQVHSTQHYLIQPTHSAIPKADASISRFAGQACVVMTADCLPLLLCAENGQEVAAIHAGWRGLLNGVIEQTIAAMQTQPEQLRAWLGPCIGPNAFEVGEEVFHSFIAQNPLSAPFFKPHGPSKWLAHLHGLAQQRLAGLGVTHIQSDTRCTFSCSNHFYSYRRDGITGRMASAIWIVNA